MLAKYGKIKYSPDFCQLTLPASRLRLANGRTKGKQQQNCDKIHVPARKFIDILFHLFVSHFVQRCWWRGRLRVRGASHSRHQISSEKWRGKTKLMLYFYGRRGKLDFTSSLLFLVLFSLVALLLWQRQEFFGLFRRLLNLTCVRSSGGTFKNCFWVLYFSLSFFWMHFVSFKNFFWFVLEFFFRTKCLTLGASSCLNNHLRAFGRIVLWKIYSHKPSSNLFTAWVEMRQKEETKKKASICFDAAFVCSLSNSSPLAQLVRVLFNW